ncbi:hypothetical protein [Hymenobacter lapidiphilus]|uniref:Uncharacterized protein n=1 Tax=Hymenobacter lapidiphilus TaxID=2608003 RepID=A0A7Y7PT21_9BACT|nr:hypothetical protein [Hymenobacter lapidiphilus]NVO33533.1 hypothetical protein [Hymenobacter lapidiphilus]
MPDFIPALVAELQPLLDAAGLHCLDIGANYSTRNGYAYEAGCFRGTVYLSLLPLLGAFTEAELRQGLQDALLDQLNAYYSGIPQL